MAVGFDAAGTAQLFGSGVNVTTAAYTGLTPGGTANAIVIYATIGQGNIGDNPTAIWDSGGAKQPMQLLALHQYFSVTFCLFGLLNPTTGAGKTCTLNWATSSQSHIVCGASFTGVVQFQNAAYNNGVGTAISVQVESNTGDIPTGLMSCGNSGVTVTTTNTQIFASNTPTNCSPLGNYIASPGTGLNTLNGTGTSSNWTAIGINVSAQTLLTPAIAAYTTRRLLKGPTRGYVAMTPAPQVQAAAAPSVNLWGQELQAPTFPPPRQNTGALAKVRQKNEFAIFPQPFPEGWQIQHYQPPNVRENRYFGVGMRGKAEFAIYSRTPPWGWEIQPPQPPNPVNWDKKAGATMPGATEGTEAAYVPPVVVSPNQWGQEPVLPPFIAPLSRANATFMVRYPGWERPQVTSPWGFDPILPTLPNPKTDNNKSSGATLRGSEWNIEKNFPWSYWADAPMPTLSNTRATPNPGIGQTLKGDDIESPLIRWYNAGWEIPPPFLSKAYAQAKVVPALSMRAGFVAFIPAPLEGWQQVQPWQPPHPKYTLSTQVRGDDGTERPLFIWRNSGWEQSGASNPTQRRVSEFDMRWGDDGIENTFVIAPTVVGWSFDPALPVTRYPQRLFYTFEHGDDGIEAPRVFLPYGWPVQPPQPPHPRPERAGAIEIGEAGIEATFSLVAPQVILDGWEGIWPQPPARPGVRAGGSIARGEDGTESPLVNFYPFGFEVQPPQPPALAYITRYKSGSIAKGDDGAEAPHPWINAGWEIQSVQPPVNPPDRLGAVGSMIGEGGIENPLIIFYPFGWPIQPPQPPKPRPERAGAVEVGEQGIEAIYFLQAPQIVLMGFEGVWPQPPARAGVRAAGSIARGDDGSERPLINFYPWGFEVQPPQPPQFPNPEQRGAAIKIKVEFAIWPAPFPEGWAIQPPQPPHPRPERAGSIMRGDDGTTNIYHFFTAPIINMGFEGVWPQPPHPRSERSGAQFGGDPGTAAPMVNWQNTGWEIAPHQPQHPRVEKFALLVGGDSGTAQVQITWFVPGWEVQSVQPPHQRPERSGALAKGDDGSENVFQFFVPPVINMGFEGVWPQPPHPRAEKWGALARGDDGTAWPLIIWRNGGWEVQPPQPPHPRPERTGSIARGDDGTEAVFFLVAPQIIPDGWEGTWPQPPHPRPERAGSIARGDEGTEGAYQIWRNGGWEVIPPQPPHPRPERTGTIMPSDTGTEAPFIFIPPGFVTWGYEPTNYQTRVRYERSGSLMRGEDGIEGLFIRWLNAGWEIQPPQPPHFGRERSGGWMPIEPGIEAKFSFIPPPALAFYQTPNPDTPLKKPGLTHSAIFAWEPPWGYSKFTVAVFYACSHITTMAATVSVSYATALTVLKTEGATTAVTETTGKSTVTSEEGETNVKGEGSTDPCKR